MILALALAAAATPYVDQRDLLELIGMKKSTGEVEAWKLYPSIIPSVGYAPQNGAVIGITTLTGIYLGDPKTTTISNIAIIGLYTSKNQILLFSRNTANLAGNEWQLQGDYRFLATNQPTYGLGSGGAGEQPMDFNFFKFHQTVLRKIQGSFYIGGSYRLDRHFDIVDQKYDPAAGVITSHAAYSDQFGFSKSAYGVSGFTAEFLYDSRDSTIAAYQGFYANASLRAYPKSLGSSQDATFVQGEVRKYISLSDEVPRNVLAFWLLGCGVVGGHMPYMALPSIGWDFANRTGRGYVQGRYRGDSEVYGEVEYRFRITNNGLIGGAVFANASTFSSPAIDQPGYKSPHEALFSTIRPAGGAGLRFMMNREARNAVTLDFAGGQGSFAVYFGAGEAF